MIPSNNFFLGILLVEENFNNSNNPLALIFIQAAILA
jgi:hypothetical protein